MKKAICSFILVLAFFGGHFAFAGVPNFQLEIASSCGNGVKEDGEQCDLFDLDGGSCETRGFEGGNLTCNPNCTFNTLACSEEEGAGGGRRIRAAEAPVTGRIILSGVQVPFGKISVLKDGQLAVSTVADERSNFVADLSALSSGNYNIAILGRDLAGRESDLFSFTVKVAAGNETQIGGIFLSPTIFAAKNKLNLGENALISGQSVPFARILIMDGAGKVQSEIVSDKNGLYNFNYLVKDKGVRNFLAKAYLQNEISAVSRTVNLYVEDEGRPFLQADLNGDGRVNLIDFSILAYWYLRDEPPTEFDLKADGRIDLVDFSIMAYYWTG